MKILDQTPNLYSKENAISNAAILNAEDSEWRYEVIHDPEGTGFSVIKVYDEDNEFIGYM